MVAQETVFKLALMLLVYHTESTPFPKLGRQTLTLEEIAPIQFDFYPERFSVQWISDTEFIFQDIYGGIKKYNAVNDTLTEFLSDEELDTLLDQFVVSYSHDGKIILLSSKRKKVYRYSSLAEYAVYNTEKKTLRKIGRGALQVVVWGSHRNLAYVQNNNVFYIPDVRFPSLEIQITKEGIPGKVYCGTTDWIYEEEVFNAAEAMWFSHNSTYLAVATFNDTNVDSTEYPYFGNPFDLSNQYSKTISFKYPKAGRTNPVVGLKIHKLSDPTSEPWNIPAPIDVVGKDHILAKVTWASDQSLVVLWLNRRQNVSSLINCNLQQGKCDIVRQQAEPNGWIEVTEPILDSVGERIIEILPLFHGDHRYQHVARFNLLSYTTEDLSPGNSTVTHIVGWNEETDTVYYIVAPVNQPWQRQLWSTSGGVIRCVSCKEPSCHCVSAKFSPDGNYAVVTCSKTNSPSKSFLYKSKDDWFTLLKDNARLREKLSFYSLPAPLFAVIRLASNVLAHVKLLLPPDMAQQEKHPMILKVYGGPGTSRVKDDFDLDYYSMYLSSNRSFIVASIDVRGSGVMDVETTFAVNGALGVIEASDTLVAIRQLIALYPFIDPDRIGVYGWSYGGYTTAMMLIYDEENTLACGASIAPVTSWQYYDTIYTERYMGTPQANPVGYQLSDVVLSAERLRGRRFLLVHGTGDDNVHVQHSMQLAKVLQHADIDFEQMTYTDETHSLIGVSRHFYHTLDRFWSDCFYR